MNIHEYQAKELLQKFGVATPRGKVASTPEEAEAIAREMGQGSRGQSADPRRRSREGDVHQRIQGRRANGKSPDEARDVAGKMLGQTLVTHQTGAAGRVVNKVLVAESVDIAREIYFAVLLDRATAAP